MSDSTRPAAPATDTDLIIAAIKRLDLDDAGIDPVLDALDRLRQRSIMLNSVAWRLCELLGDVGPDDHHIEIDGDIVALADRAKAAHAELVEKLATEVALADRLGKALGFEAGCPCNDPNDDGSPGLDKATFDVLLTWAAARPDRWQSSAGDLR